MDDCLLVQINHLYQLYLFSLSRYNPDLKPLKDLDTLLKCDFPEFYEKSDEYTTTVLKIPFKPIHNWRRGRNLSIQRILYHIADSVNKMR